MTIYKLLFKLLLLLLYCRGNSADHS